MGERKQKGLGKVIFIKEYLTEKLYELKVQEQFLNRLVKNGQEDLIGELLDVIEEIVVISVKLDRDGEKNSK